MRRRRERKAATLCMAVLMLGAAGPVTAQTAVNECMGNGGSVPAVSMWGLGALLVAIGVASAVLTRRSRGSAVAVIALVGFAAMAVLLGAPSNAQAADAGKCCAAAGATGASTSTTASTTTTSTTQPLQRDLFWMSLRGRYIDDKPFGLESTKKKRRVFAIEGSGAYKDRDGAINSGAVKLWNNGELNFDSDSSPGRDLFQLSGPESFSLRHAASEELLSGTVESGQLVGLGVSACGLFDVNIGGRRLPVDVTARWLADRDNLREGFAMLEFGIKW